MQAGVKVQILTPACDAMCQVLADLNFRIDSIEKCNNAQVVGDLLLIL
jgi:hypothetical protein